MLLVRIRIMETERLQGRMEPCGMRIKLKIK